MEFYAVGTRTRKNEDGEWTTSQVIINNLPNDRLGADREAQRIAKRDKIDNVKVYPFRKKS